MADAETKTTFPRIPASNWWALRAQAKKSPPRNINTEYLQTVLNVQEKPASNLLGPLKQVGLIDGTGIVATELLDDWRDDAHYAEACASMIERVYPEQLRELCPPPDPDVKQVAGWMSRRARIGEAAARQCANFYSLLASGDPTPSQARARSSEATPSAAAESKAKKAVATAKAPKRARRAAADGTGGGTHLDEPLPQVQINVQVQIPATASAEQIDNIFASMAKHLYRR